jgi:AraC family transcriptional regulator of adaptative response / DNA-3-methyladenine glycosylase II
MPETRGEAIRQLARASLDGRVQLGAGITPEELSAQLVALPGIGPWTAQYVAMRALGHPDAFPAEDIVLRKVAVPGRTLGARELLRHAEAWRPWRAYAVMYLWRDAALLRAAAAVARRTASGQPAGG